eukprot:gene30529-37766_t
MFLLESTASNDVERFVSEVSDYALKSMTDLTAGEKIETLVANSDTLKYLSHHRLVAPAVYSKVCWLSQHSTREQKLSDCKWYVDINEHMLLFPYHGRVSNYYRIGVLMASTGLPEGLQLAKVYCLKALRMHLIMNDREERVSVEDKISYDSKIAEILSQLPQMVSSSLDMSQSVHPMQSIISSGTWEHQLESMLKPFALKWNN